MNRLGLAIYYLTRGKARMSRRFWRWVLGSFLHRKAKACGSINIYGFSRFINVSGLSIGENVHVNYGANWVCDGGLTIGDNVHISSNSTIYTRNHNFRGGALPYDDENIARPVSIGRNVWIGANVTILPGSQISDGVIIGAGSVVHGKIPALTILGAASASVIGARDTPHYEDLERKGIYGGPGGKPIFTMRDQS